MRTFQMLGVFLAGALMMWATTTPRVQTAWRTLGQEKPAPPSEPLVVDQVKLSHSKSESPAPKTDVQFAELLKKVTDQASLAQLRQIFLARTDQLDREQIDVRYLKVGSHDNFIAQAELALQAFRELEEPEKYWVARTSLEVNGKEHPLVILFSVHNNASPGAVLGGADFAAITDVSRLSSSLMMAFPGISGEQKWTTFYDQLGSLRKRDGRSFVVDDMNVDAIEPYITHFAVEAPHSSRSSAIFETLGAVSKKWTAQRGIDWSPISEAEALTLQGEFINKP